jgi:hypothetical protein
MTQIMLDGELRAQLHDLDEPVEFCDVQGRVVGHYLPDHLYRSWLVAWSKQEVSDEELQHARAEPRGKPLSDLWRRSSLVIRP